MDTKGDLDLGEHRSGTEIVHGFISGNKFEYKPIKSSIIDGLAIYEGDILLGSGDEIKSRTSPRDIPAELGFANVDDDDLASRGVAITGRRFRWPKKIVPYSIDPNLANKERVTSAIKHWEDNTLFRFVQPNTDSTLKHKNYISFEDQGGCFSSVGMQGIGKQVISLGHNCTVGNAIHELGHALGLWHEQSREDRDKYVKILWQNIEQDKWHNFEQQIVDGDDIGEYDYDSIMHYSRTAFSKNGNDTIIPISDHEIGQRRGLSKEDIIAIESAYANI